MHIKDIFQKGKTIASFEFFPPKSLKASDDLYQSISELNALRPTYVSVTYGAGGSTRELTHDLVQKLHKETELTIIPHLTCVGHSYSELESIIGEYNDIGIENLMILRGDPPKGEIGFQAHPDGPKYAAELIHFIKKKFSHLGLGVAGFPEGHPETPNRLHEMNYLKMKVDAGADYICTQLFFDNHDFYDFKERCALEGIHVPIVAGIMPISSRKGMNRMSELALGSRFPAKLLKAMSRVSTEEQAKALGIHWASEQVRDLLDNEIDGIHFYTLNKSKSTIEIYESLGLTDSQDFIEKKTLNSFLPSAGLI